MKKTRAHNPVGLTLAVGLFWLSVTPSLLPRDWLLQGVVSGLLAAAGYGIGVLVSVALRQLTGWQPGPPAGLAGWLLGSAGGMVVLASLYQGTVWQREVYRVTGQVAPARYTYAGVVPVALAIVAVAVGLARLLRAAARRLAGLLGGWVPDPVARGAGALTVVVLFAVAFDGAVWNGRLSPANVFFKTVNGETKPGTMLPTSPALSGGPASIVSWASLGRQGREFVAGAPTVAQLRGFGAARVMQPIRVYAGVDSAPTIPERAALAVRELERTGGFTRRVLCVITTTGTGWIDARSVEPLEYMYGGDTALVAMQYSYLPSLLSFLADRNSSQQAGRELFDQVYARWSRLPDGRRPKLLVFGESLGSFGGEAAFSGIADIRDRTDGVLWVGPPNSNRLRAAFTAERDPGSPETLPVYQHGRTVRFAGAPDDLASPSSSWAAPRVVYLQHASDPIVWWTPRLLTHEPDWLRQPTGQGPVPSMRWFPLVTFVQVSADVVYSAKVPAGHGHAYGNEPVDAWAAIVPPPGWTDSQTARLKAVVGTGETER